MVHTWASVLLKTPELMLDPSEVKQLSTSYETFSEHHEVPILTAKRMSEINLVATALSIYGTRFVAIRNRKKEEKQIHVVNGMPQHASVSQRTM
jgi:Zn-dependent peptidase ImmA (M78 family)